MFLKNLLKNSFNILLALAMVFSIGLSFSPVDVSAQLIPDQATICPDGDCPLGVTADNIPTDRQGIAQTIINVATFITFIAVALSVLFMVYGGVTYITAGTSDGNEKGKQILVNATIGLVISIVAYTVVALISNLVNSGDFLSDVITN